MLSEISQSQKDKYCIIQFILYTLSSQKSETDSRMVVSKGWGGGGNGELSFNEYRVSVLQDEESSRDGW